MWKVCIAYISFILITHAVSAQESTGNFEIGIHAGAAIYQGDLTPSPFGSFKTVRAASGVHANVILSEAFSFRQNFDFGTLEGDDSKYNDKPWRQQRNFAFRTSFKEFSLLFAWDIWGRNFDIREGFSPYLFFGVGYTFFNGNSNYAGFNRTYFRNDPELIAGLDEDRAKPKLIGMPVVPLGGGVRFQLSPRISLKAEISYRLSGTDYLDGFSKAADTKQMDRFYTSVIGLIFSPGRKSTDYIIKCPGIRN
jgi:opacity protein-like surface antigen